MINSDFREKVEKGLGCVVILAGSGNDEPHIGKIAKSLREYNIPFEVRVASAHKQSDKVSKIVGEYDALKGHLVYIAIAGGTDALSGTSSFISRRLTISCPPDHPNMSCLTNPSGSSNLYAGRPENAARAVAQIFSELNLEYTGIIEGQIARKRDELDAADLRLQKKYSSKEKS